MTTNTISLTTAGNLVSDLGTPRFTQGLWAWLRTMIDPHCYHMSAMRFSRSAPLEAEQLAILFFGGESDPDESRLALGLYQRDKEWLHDNQLMQLIRQARDPQLVVTHNAVTAPTAYGRMMAQSVLGEECMLIGVEHNHVYLLSIFRPRGVPSFTLNELTLLRQTCHLLIPLMAQHDRLSPPCHPPSQDLLRQYLDQCLAKAGARLSTRETLICHAMLQGQSVPDIADKLSISHCSVRTYMERALTKLGLSSKTELFAWCVTMDKTDDPHVEGKPVWQ